MHRALVPRLCCDLTLFLHSSLVNPVLLLGAEVSGPPYLFVPAYKVRDMHAQGDVSNRACVFSFSYHS